MINQINERLNRYFTGTLMVTSFAIGASMTKALLSHPEAANDADYAVYPAIGVAAICAQIGLFAWAHRAVAQVERNSPFVALELGM